MFLFFHFKKFDFFKFKNSYFKIFSFISSSFNAFNGIYSRTEVKKKKSTVLEATSLYSKQTQRRTGKGEGVREADDKLAVVK